MLLNDFYTIVKHEAVTPNVSAVIAFNKSHKIFQGHFPGHPVVPGVCMMQILREISQEAVSKKLKIVSGDNMKFLAIINPEETPEVEVKIQYSLVNDLYNVNASIQQGAVTFFKFKGSFQIV